MAGDTTGGLTFFLSISKQHLSQLLSIRHWEDLRIATDENLVWVKNITQIQLDSLEIKAMPFKKLYYQENHQLFPVGSLLPERNIPSVIWSPIRSGLPLTLPAQGKRSLAVTKGIPVKLIQTEDLQESTAMLVDIDTLAKYMNGAPSFRLQGLTWLIIAHKKALVFGIPLLPLPGETLWSMGNFLIPAGHQLEFPILASIIQQETDATGRNYLLWNRNNEVISFLKNNLKPLTIYSFRETIKS
jgi:hypothetical protein